MSLPRDYADSFTNLTTKLGTPKDKSFQVGFIERPNLTFEALNALYEKDAISARIVDRLVDDGTREGFSLKGVDQAFDFGEVESELEDLDALTAMADGWRWSRLYGGAIVVMNVNDGGAMDEPLNLRNATKLSSLQVIESPWITPSGFNPGLGARAFRRPTHYEITVPFGASAGTARRVHRSRVIRFDGVRVTPNRMIENNGWGPSILDRVFEEVSQLGEVMGYGRNIMHEISVMVLRLKSLREQLCGSEEDRRQIGGVIESIRQNIDNLHTLVLDSEDEYVEVGRNVDGLDSLIDRFVEALVRATDMPRTILLGEQPSGMNASADSEIRSWFDFVAAQQRLQLTPKVNRLLEVLFATKRPGAAPDEWTVDWNPLWQPTEEEKAKTAKARAETDQIYILTGVVEPDEVRQRLIDEGELTPIENPDLPIEDPEPDTTEGPDDGEQDLVE